MANQTEELSIDLPITEQTDTDVKDILKEIKDHLKKWNELDKIKMNKTSDTLIIDNNKIEIQCMLHYLSGDDNYLEQYSNSCSPIIKQHTIDGKLDLKTLIRISLNKDFLKDANFYSNLYGFNLSMINYIATSKTFNNLEIKYKYRLLENLEEFINQSINYLSDYINTYQVIDNNIIHSSYNLLYLLNVLAYSRANVGKSINDLINLYNKLIQTIKENIQIYNSIDKNKLRTLPSSNNQNDIDEIDKLSQELTERLRIMEKEKTSLEINVKAINENSSVLEQYADVDIKNTIINLKNEII